jgi:hypothetical protein
VVEEMAHQVAQTPIQRECRILAVVAVVVAEMVLPLLVMEKRAAQAL